MVSGLYVYTCECPAFSDPDISFHIQNNEISGIFPSQQVIVLSLNFLMMCHVYCILALPTCLKNEKRDNKQCLLDMSRRVTDNNKRLISKRKKSERKKLKKAAIQFRILLFCQKIIFSVSNSFMQMSNVSTLCVPSIRCEQAKL